MLTTPSLKMPIRPFDATKSYEFIFYVNGGNQVLKNNLIVEDAETGAPVYNGTQESFGYKHELLANKLVNGKQYKVRLRTGGADDKWSEFCSYELFYCFSPARITIPKEIIDTDNQNRVGNQTVDFEAVYTQDEYEVLQSYRFLLYDSNKNLIKSFPEKFYDGVEKIKQQIAGLENGELYYLQVRTESVNGLLSDTSLIWFRPFYLTPRLSAVITPVNLKEQGAIKLSSNIVQIIGKLYDVEKNEIIPSDVEYIEEKWIDLTRPSYESLVFDKGFEVMQSNYTMKLWCKNVLDDVVFLTLYSRNEKGVVVGKTDLVKRNDKIHAYKTLTGNNFKAHFASDEFDFTNKLEYMIHIRQTEGLMDIVVKEVTEDDIGI